MRKRLLNLFAVGALTLCQSAWAEAPPCAGHYTVLIRGYWRGIGDATVTANAVTIMATVKDGTGRSGQLVISNLPLIDSHFRGSGTVLGIGATVDGRAEPRDPVAANPGSSRQPVVSNARVAATIFSNGHGGRLAGGRDGSPAPTPPSSDD